MIGDKKVDTVQYIAEIADIARHRGVGRPSNAAQSVDEGPLSPNHSRNALLLAADAADRRRPTAMDQASSGQVCQPDAEA